MNGVGKFWSGVGHQPLVYSTDERKIFEASFQIAWTIVAFGVCGLALVAVWAHGAVGSTGPVLSAFFGADMLVAAASAAVGALFGFVFGIPRTLDPAARVAVAAAADQAGQKAASHAAMAANTNLERISDWLTTLLIGATLVQIKDIAKWVGALGQNLVATGPAANDAIVPIIVIYFFALAFLGVYLITRLYLTSAFVMTMGMLSGVSPIDGLAGLKQKLDSALASGDPKNLAEATSAYNQYRSTGANPDDAELNGKFARVMARRMSLKVADLQSDAKSALMQALQSAVSDPTQKANLKAESDAGTLVTGDDDLDLKVREVLL